MENVTKQKRGSMGGQVMAVRQRNEALEKYYLNPNICKFCNAIIQVPDNAKVPAIKLKKFCNQSCAAKFNNIGKNRHRSIERTEQDIKYPTKVTRKKDVIPLSVYKQNISILNKTKGELFYNRKNWQSARSSIQKSARDMYFMVAKHNHCCHKECKYDTHIDVAHIKSVSDFDSSSKVSDINDKYNLIGLCKNHHWEFDNGYISLDDIDLPI